MIRNPLFSLMIPLLALGACDDKPKKTNNQLPDCGNGVAEPTLDEQCDGADLGGLTCLSLNQGFDGGLLVCDFACRLDTSGCLGCDDACDVDGLARCSDDNTYMERCEPVESGCLGWVRTDCVAPTPICVLIDEQTRCNEVCLNRCDLLDAQRCNADADGIETCVTGAQGCFEWRNAVCDPSTPRCDDTGDWPVCVP